MKWPRVHGLNYGANDEQESIKCQRDFGATKELLGSIIFRQSTSTMLDRLISKFQRVAGLKDIASDI